MTYHRVAFTPSIKWVYFAGSSVKNHRWVEKEEDALVLPTQDAENVKRYFKAVEGKDVTLVPVLPSELVSKLFKVLTPDGYLVNVITKQYSTYAEFSVDESKASVFTSNQIEEAKRLLSSTSLKLDEWKLIPYANP